MNSHIVTKTELLIALTFLAWSFAIGFLQGRVEFLRPPTIMPILLVMFCAVGGMIAGLAVSEIFHK